MKKFIFALLTFSILLLVGCPTDTEQEKKEEPISYDAANINYDTHHSECVMDIYRSADEVRPVVMLIHGGAWIKIVLPEPFSSFQPLLDNGLGRSGMVKFKDLFLNNGYHVANIDYRLINIVSPDGTNYNDMLDDIKSAVQFLYDNSDDYKIDTSKIVMYGYSAGAHLAELYSYKVTNSPIPVKLCVGRAGPADFWNEEFRSCNIIGSFTNVAASTASSAFTPEMMKPMIPGLFNLPADTSDDILANFFRVRLITNLLGIQTNETSDLNAILTNDNYAPTINDISPIFHVKSSSPRTILLHGKKDTLVPYSIAESLNKKLADSSVEHEFISLENSGHSLDDPQDSAKLTEFNNKVLQALQ